MAKVPENGHVVKTKMNNHNIKTENFSQAVFSFDENGLLVWEEKEIPLDKIPD